MKKYTADQIEKIKKCLPWGYVKMLRPILQSEHNKTLTEASIRRAMMYKHQNIVVIYEAKKLGEKYAPELYQELFLKKKKIK